MKSGGKRVAVEERISKRRRQRRKNKYFRVPRYLYPKQGCKKRVLIKRIINNIYF